jgi:hypothetical protein
MFGSNNNDNQAVMGSPTVQNPSMLDNVSQQDFQTPDDTTSSDNSTAATSQHTITTDNPFVQDIVAPTASAPAATPMQDESTATPVISSVSSPSEPASASPSAPVAPPVVEEPTVEKEIVYDDPLAEEVMPAISAGTATTTIEPVDHDKLAAIKQEALEHLEPLAEHIDGTPEETFRTTMMMIQANDNHMLLEKALDAAKKIEDDKTRAQAMLDIINEINYFSQVSE